MKKEWADKWIKALRSGDFKQGKGKLRDENNNYCCLGVLCEIMKNEAKSDTNIYLSKEVKILAELDNFYGYRKGKTNTEGLADLNDKGISFAEIANIIEEEWEIL